MSFIARVLLGIVVMLIGAGMVLKTERLMDWFGEVSWAEDKLGPGQSRLFYKLFGILVAFLGMFIMTNIISDILGGIANLLTPG